MIFEMSSQEAWKVIDAIKAYPENYHVSDNIQSMFKKIQKDIEQGIKNETLGMAPKKNVPKATNDTITKRATKKSTRKNKRG